MKATFTFRGLIFRLCGPDRADLKRQARRIEVEAAGARAAKRHDALRLRGLVRADGLI